MDLADHRLPRPAPDRQAPGRRPAPPMGTASPPGPAHPREGPPGVPEHPREDHLSGQRTETRQARPRTPSRVEEPAPGDPPRRGQAPHRRHRKARCQEANRLNGKFNVRRYNRKLLIKPGKAALKRLRNRLAAEMRILRGSNVMAVLAKLGPIIRGWAAYYRGVVSSRLFSSLDHYLWQL